MSDKLIAGLVTAVAVAPVCAVCIFGPAALASAAAGIAGWLGGLDPVVITGLAVLAGIAAYGVVHRRRSRRVGPSQEGEINR